MAKSMLRDLPGSEKEKIAEFSRKVFFNLKKVLELIRPTYFVTFLQTWRQLFEQNLKFVHVKRPIFEKIAFSLTCSDVWNKRKNNWLRPKL